MAPKITGKTLFFLQTRTRFESVLPNTKFYNLVDDSPTDEE